MKILHIAGGSDTSGAVVAATRLSNALNEHGFGVNKLYTTSRGGNLTSCGKLDLSIRKAERKIFKKVLMENTPISTNFLPTPRCVVSEMAEVDIIHIHWCGSGLISIFQLGKLVKPVVVTTHDYWFFNALSHLKNDFLNFWGADKILKLKYNFLNKKNVAVIAPSNWMFEHIKKHHKMFHNPKFYHVPNITNQGQNLPYVKNNNRRMSLLFIANSINDPNKNLKYLCDINQSKEIRNSFMFGIIGLGKHKVIMKDNQNFHFYGRVDPGQMPVIMSKYDGVIILSKEETFSLTAYEAIAQRKFVISSKNGGLNDLLDENLISEINIKNLRMARMQLSDFYVKWASGVKPTTLNESYSEQSICLNHKEIYERVLSS